MYDHTENLCYEQKKSDSKHETCYRRSYRESFLAIGLDESLTADRFALYDNSSDINAIAQLVDRG